MSARQLCAVERCGLCASITQAIIGAQAVPKPYINPVAYERVASEARNQLEFGTDMRAMVAASAQIRDLDPEHPLIAALEARIQRASKINFMALRAKLAARTGVRE